MKQNALQHTKKTLALAYFPEDDYRSGWRKMKRYLSEERSLTKLFTTKRQTILPRELRVIYARLGVPRI